MCWKPFFLWKQFISIWRSLTPHFTCNISGICFNTGFFSLEECFLQIRANAFGKSDWFIWFLHCPTLLQWWIVSWYWWGFCHWRCTANFTLHIVSCNSFTGLCPLCYNTVIVRFSFYILDSFRIFSFSTQRYRIARKLHWGWNNWPLKPWAYFPGLIPLQTSFGCICRKGGYSFVSREKTGLYYLISIVTIRRTAIVEVKLYIMKHLRNREFV